MKNSHTKNGFFITITALLVFGMLLPAAAIASNIDTDDKYAWNTNAGWMNFRPGFSGFEGVTVYADHLEGYAWSESLGWFRLGTHTVGGAHTYGNSTATDYGVNHDGAGNLSGYAWSANAGWINFSPTDGGVTIDTATGSFDGYAWSESAGWIHFKNTSPAYNVVTAYRPATTTTTTSTTATAPVVAGVMYVTSSATAGTYTVGDVIPIVVHFNQLVWVSGTPQLVLNINESPVMAYYGSGSGTDTLTFLYTVAAGDMISNLEYWSEWALDLNGGRIWDNMDNDVILELPAPGAPGSLSGDITLSLVTDYPVFRLYCHVTKKHLFTMDENEKDTLIALTDADGAAVWRDESIAYYAFHPLQYKAASRLQRNTLQAVHRFYSENLQTHLFTIDENEKETLIANAADVWKYEGPAFYVPASEQDGTVPVYRFYSESLLVHLFTTDENEKNTLIETAGDVWRFEGVAYYAYP
ncbi:hypothetical protein QUF90_24005 [Desulfococcaceae bacterium HSG9]|nr:hypothetical protein [Desulfococcaceae bacterium HSG9]